jgi:hypothetical protein
MTSAPWIMSDRTLLLFYAAVSGAVGQRSVAKSHLSPAVTRCSGDVRVFLRTALGLVRGLTGWEGLSIIIS